MLSLEDSIYIQQVLDGKTSSFTHIVEKYKDMVYTVVYRIVRQHEDAEEIAQDTFIKVFNNLDSFKAEAKLSTWIYTIAYRNAISKVKLKKIDFLKEENLPETDNNVLVFSQIESLQEEEQKFYLKKAIETLSELDSVIISLFYLDDCSVQEICNITNLGESNVKIRLHRSRRELKFQLEALLKSETKSLLP